MVINFKKREAEIFCACMVQDMFCKFNMNVIEDVMNWLDEYKNENESRRMMEVIMKCMQPNSMYITASQAIKIITIFNDNNNKTSIAWALLLCCKDSKDWLGQNVWLELINMKDRYAFFIHLWYRYQSLYNDHTGNKNWFQTIISSFSSDYLTLVAKLVTLRCNNWDIFFTSILSKLPKASFGRNIRYDVLMYAIQENLDLMRTEKNDLSDVIGLFSGIERVDVLEKLLPIWDPSKISQGLILSLSPKSQVKKIMEIFQSYNKLKDISQLPWKRFKDSKTNVEDKQCIICMENEKCIALQCGHINMCLTCCEKRWNNNQVACITCRQTSTVANRVYL